MKHSEHILVVPRVALIAAGIPVAHSLLGVDRAAQVCCNLEQLVATAGLFLPRYAMEQDPTYKQIIPYMVFLHERQIFVMQRSAQAGEQRLASAYTVGIGGHVRAGDLGPGGLAAWGKREFMEEGSYEDDFASITCLGVVNDERNQVGMVHLGAVYALHATSGAIAIRSELASGVLMDRAACLAQYNAMETWSQHVVDALIQHNYI